MLKNYIYYYSKYIIKYERSKIAASVNTSVLLTSVVTNLSFSDLHCLYAYFISLKTVLLALFYENFLSVLLLGYTY